PARPALYRAVPAAARRLCACGGRGASNRPGSAVRFGSVSGRMTRWEEHPFRVRRGKSNMVSLLSALGCLLAAPVPAPQPAIIVTAAQWKGVQEGEGKWHSIHFDDSAWTPALEVTGPVSIATVFLLPTKARWIWGSRSEQCFLRRTFDAPRGFRRAEMLFATDEMGM